MNAPPSRSIWRAVGPGLITASVVLGPGSIVVSSQLGIRYGAGMVWLLVAGVVFMATFTAMAARVGCVTREPLLEVVARRWGRWLAVAVGASSFAVAAGFQFGNNLGVGTALASLTGIGEGWWIVVASAAALVFLFRAKRLYTLLERVMAGLVLVMIVAFFANLLYAQLNTGDVLRGLVPRRPSGGFGEGRALLATTCSVVAALYAAYLAQEKRWGPEDVALGLRDAITGIVILGAISLAIMLGAAGTLAGRQVEIQSAGDLARQFEALLGPSARIVFCLGLAAAAFSSFIVNSIVGGCLLASGLGLGHRLSDPAVRVASAACLLVGTVVALVVVAWGYNPVPAIVTAQAATLLAVPLCAAALLWASSSRSLMGELRNRPVTLALGLLGFLALSWMTIETAASLIRRFT